MMSRVATIRSNEAVTGLVPSEDRCERKVGRR